MNSTAIRLRGAKALPAVLAMLTLAMTIVHPAAADILPTERRTIWNPGIPGGIPVRTTVCATVNASTYGNGTTDATQGIQAAIDACPVGQVVQLSAGDFKVNATYPITITKGIVLRGAGPAATKLLKSGGADNPLVLVGQRWLNNGQTSVNLTANAPKGATSIQVTSTTGFSVGQLVVVDELTDTSYVTWGKDPAVAPGGEGRGWFTRYDRPVGQMLEIASISGNTVTFTTPLHIAFDTVHKAQLTRWTFQGVKNAGIEDLYVRGGKDDNITLRLAMYSWVRNVESDYSLGDSFGLDACFRCVVREAYVHDTQSPWPGGGGYLLSFSYYTADSLVENNTFINGNKVMVMRASGGGNVIGYNYFDNGYIANKRGWMETGLNASHLAEPHFELFEGNYAFNADGDDTWGGAVYITLFRNHLSGKRRSYSDLNNRRAAGLMWGHYYYSFVGNVLGFPGQSPSPYSGFRYENSSPPWGDDPVPMWRLGYSPTDWRAQPEPRVLNTLHRHANFDYATNSVKFTSGYDQILPASLYLTSKPSFFGTLPWPWVDPVGTTKLYSLPAKARYDAGTPFAPALGAGSSTLSSPTKERSIN